VSLSAPFVPSENSARQIAEYLPTCAIHLPDHEHPATHWILTQGCAIGLCETAYADLRSELSNAFATTLLPPLTFAPTHPPTLHHPSSPRARRLALQPHGAPPSLPSATPDRCGVGPEGIGPRLSPS